MNFILEDVYAFHLASEENFPEEGREVSLNLQNENVEKSPLFGYIKFRILDIVKKLKGLHPSYNFHAFVASHTAGEETSFNSCFTTDYIYPCEDKDDKEKMKKE